MVDKNAHYLMCKGGVFYFTRHVPNDLQRHYETPRIDDDILENNEDYKFVTKMIGRSEPSFHYMA